MMHQMLAYVLPDIIIAIVSMSVFIMILGDYVAREHARLSKKQTIVRAGKLSTNRYVFYPPWKQLLSILHQSSLKTKLVSGFLILVLLGEAKILAKDLEMLALLIRIQFMQ